MQSLLNQHDLFKTLFQILPAPAIVVDNNYQVIAINDACQKFFAMSRQDAYLQLCGKVFRCIHASEPGGCGKTHFCDDCLIRHIVGQALEGQEFVRNKGGYHVWLQQELERIDVLVTAKQLICDNNVFAFVLLEKMANMTQLHGLLPICYSCHRIFDKQHGWTVLEEYIKNHSEADFTHDICPNCIELARLRVKRE